MDHVWISSEESLFTLDVDDIAAAQNNDELTFTNEIPVPVEAAYDVYDDDKKILWVGEFYEPNAYPTDPSHHLVNRAGEMQFAWMVGYKLRPNTDMLTHEQWDPAGNEPAKPDYVFPRSVRYRERSSRRREFLWSRLTDGRMTVFCIDIMTR